MSRLFLVRHAHTEMAGRFCGISDPPLSATGREQLPLLVQKLQDTGLQHIFCSDRLRARQTAEALAEAARLPICLLPGLCEMHFGKWEGLAWPEIEAQYPDYALRWLHSFPQFPVPDGEDFAHFQTRVQNAMDTIVNQVGDESTAVVSHAGVIRAYLMKPLGISPHFFTTIACDYVSAWESPDKNGVWRLRE